MPRGGRRPGAGRKRKIPLGFEELLEKFSTQAERLLSVRLRQFHITKEQFDALLSAQHRKCPICGDMLATNWVIDHDHMSGRVRGLLHAKCNQLLGLANDDVRRLEAAIDYLIGNGSSMRRRKLRTEEPSTKAPALT
jgi:hypothetical protein